jgi:DNA topoisomerase-3
LKKRLREGVGIGTEATRDKCIETLITRKFVTRNGRELIPTDEAMRFNTLLPGVMRNPDLTAMWQQMNDDVLARRATYEDFMSKTKPWLQKMVERSNTFFQAGQFGERKRPSNAPVNTEFKCFGQAVKPGCGSPLRLIPEVRGKYKAFFGCSNAACKKTFDAVDDQPIERAPRTDASAATGPICPQCQKGHLARRQRKDGSGYFWGCSSWKEGCAAIFSDLDGEPDLEGKSKGSGWRNGAPPVVKPAGSTWKGRASRPPAMPVSPRRT